MASYSKRFARNLGLANAKNRPDSGCGKLPM
jgi:hypothetical protein